MQAFEDGASDGVKEGTGKRKGDCNFLASVFANISMAPATRQLLLTPRPPFPQPAEATPSEDDEPLLSKIVVYTGHPDTIRRGGALGCIKNCAIDRASMGWLLAREGEIFFFWIGCSANHQFRGPSQVALRSHANDQGC